MKDFLSEKGRKVKRTVYDYYSEEASEPIKERGPVFAKASFLTNKATYSYQLAEEAQDAEPGDFFETEVRGSRKIVKIVAVEPVEDYEPILNYETVDRLKTLSEKVTLRSELDRFKNFGQEGDIPIEQATIKLDLMQEDFDAYVKEINKGSRAVWYQK